MRRNREYYKIKYDKMMEEYNYIMQKNEIIIQCNEKYPSYWFISNMGYLLSVYGSKIKILRPNHKYTGKKSKNGRRAGQDWYYYDGECKIRMHKIIAEHFLLNEFESLEDVEIHHIRKRNTFSKNQPQFCNRADNLQILPKSVHKSVSYYANHTQDQLDDEVMRKVEESGCPNYQLTSNQMEQFLAMYIPGVQLLEPAIVYTKRHEDEVEAHPLKDLKELHLY